MTTSEIMSSLSDAVLCDQRILSAPERELLANLLQRAQRNPGDGAVAAAIASSVGEIVAQRAYGVLGESIMRRLAENLAEPDQIRKQRSKTIMAGPPGGPGQGPFPPSPNPPGPHLRTAGPPGGPGQGPFPPSPNPPGPHATVRALQSRSENVAVAEMPEILPAKCVILEEFLAPAELSALLRHTFDHEADFQLSEVVSPGVTGGIVDHEYRRSRVLMNLAGHQAVVVNRIQCCWPRILSGLEHAEFTASNVEAQITASNDGDFFHWHSDNSQEVNAPREITFVYFFHREPKNFRGGELRIYDSRRENNGYTPMANYRTVVPQQNQIVLFASSLAHEITPVECPSRAFADSRFTVNGWFHR